MDRRRALSDTRPLVFGAILKQDTSSPIEAGLLVHDLVNIAATESGLLSATDAKARVGGFLAVARHLPHCKGFT